MTLSNISAFQSFDNLQPDASSTSTSVEFSRYRKIIEYESAAWTNQLKERFVELLQLPTGWDGYQGTSLSIDCFNFTQSVLNSLCRDEVPPPSMVPGGDGTLQLEWHLLDVDIELDVLGIYNVSAYMFDHKTNEELEIELAKDFTVVDSWIEKLATRNQYLSTAA